MNKYGSFRKLLMAGAVAAAMGVSGPGLADDKPLSQEAREARMEGQILGTYTLNRHLNPFDFDVEVNGNTAIISGEVEDSIDKELAEQIARGVAGIERVENRVVVNPDVEVRERDTNERTFGDAVSDATITASVKSKLLWNSHTDGLDIKVETRNGNVMLSGTADSEASKDLAARLAENTEGVRDVDNRLRVGAKSDTGRDVDDRTADATTAVSDAWITSKVKSSFLFSRNLPATDINVDTRNGVVTLSGAVATGAERDLAIEVAKGIRGVKEVKAEALDVAS
jgi:osmotically-inducible protein OsmY